MSQIITYGEYLFSQLLIKNNTPFTELPYDIQFTRIQALYNNFEKSAYNNNSKPIYECMQEYINTRAKEFLQ